MLYYTVENNSTLDNKDTNSDNIVIVNRYIPPIDSFSLAGVVSVCIFTILVFIMSLLLFFPKLINRDSSDNRDADMVFVILVLIGFSIMMSCRYTGSYEVNYEKAVSHKTSFLIGLVVLWSLIFMGIVIAIVISILDVASMGIYKYIRRILWIVNITLIPSAIYCTVQYSYLKKNINKFLREYY